MSDADQPRQPGPNGGSADYDTYGASPALASFSPSDLVDLSGLFRRVWHRRTIVLGTLLFGMCMSMLYIYLARPIYSARSVIEMHSRRPRIVGEEGAVLGETANSSAVIADALNTQFHKMQGQSVRTAVIEALERMTGKVPEIRQYAGSSIENYIGNVVSLGRIRGTYLVEIVAESESPDLAAVIANTYARTSVEVVKDLTRNMSMEAVTWLQEQIDTYEKEVLNNEAKLIAFGQKHGVSALQSSLAAAQQAIIEISEDLVQYQTMASTLADTVENLERIKASPESAGTLPSSTPRADTIQERLADYAEAQEVVIDVLSKYTVKHPDSVTAARAERAARSAVENEVARAIETARADLAIAEEQVDSIQANKVHQIRLAEELQRRIDKYNTDVIPLQRALESADSSYKGLLERIEQARLAADEDTSLLTVHELATAPVAPVRPRSTLILLISVVASFGCGCVLALLVDTLQDRVSQVRDIEADLGENLLAVVAHVPRSSAGKKMALITHTDKFSAVAESIAGLRASLVAQGNRPESGGWVILVTSPGPSEGKTSTSCNLAIAMAKAHDSVFVIDGDMRRPQLHDVFGISEGEETLMEVLMDGHEGPEAFARLPHRTQVENIDIALGHPVEGTSPTEVLATGRFEEFVNWARQQYSVVIIDSPPLGILSEALVFGQLADDVILVCRYDKTRKDVLRHAVKDLRKNSCPLTGLVLNDFRAAGTSSSYAYRHYHYANYAARNRKQSQGKAAAKG